MMLIKIKFLSKTLQRLLNNNNIFEENKKNDNIITSLFSYLLYLLFQITSEYGSH